MREEGEREADEGKRASRPGLCFGLSLSFYDLQSVATQKETEDRLSGNGYKRRKSGIGREEAAVLSMTATNSSRLVQLRVGSSVLLDDVVKANLFAGVILLELLSGTREEAGSFMRRLLLVRRKER
jgi:hypothetical protein